MKKLKEINKFALTASVATLLVACADTQTAKKNETEVRGDQGTTVADNSLLHNKNNPLPAGGTQGIRAAEPNENSNDKNIIPDIGVPPSDPSKTEITSVDATKIAEQHIGLRQYSWGRTNGVSEHEGKYYVTFTTPEAEKRLLGTRTIIVDKNTGVPVIMPRR